MKLKIFGGSPKQVGLKFDEWILKNHKTMNVTEKEIISTMDEIFLVITFVSIAPNIPTPDPSGGETIG